MTRRLAFVKTQLLLFKSRKARPAERKSKVSGVLDFPTQCLWTRARVGEGPRSWGRKKNQQLPASARHGARPGSFLGLVLAASWGSSLQPPWGSTLQPPRGSSPQPPWCTPQGPRLQWGAQGWRVAPKVLNQHKVALGNAPHPPGSPPAPLLGLCPPEQQRGWEGAAGGAKRGGGCGVCDTALKSRVYPPC